MPDTGWILVASGSEEDVGGEAWTSESNVTADDGSYANTGGNGLTNWLHGQDLGAPLVGDETIDGFKVRIQASSDANRTIENVQMVLAGARSGTAKNPAQSLTGTDTNYDFGGPTDLWGLSSPSASDVNATGFGFAMQGDHVGGPPGGLDVDAMWVKAYYTPAAAGFRPIVTMFRDWLSGILDPWRPVWVS